MVIRHAVRHIRATQENLIDDFLREYGWMGPAVPYGAKPVTVLRRAPEESELAPVEGNTVFISHGGQPDSRPVQLGGGLLRTEHVIFVDILGENETIALSIAADVHDRLTGLFGGTRYVRPVDQSTGHVLAGYVGEYEDVEREQPRPELGAWQSVRATLVLDFPGEDS